MPVIICSGKAVWKIRLKFNRVKKAEKIVEQDKAKRDVPLAL